MARKNTRNKFVALILIALLIFLGVIYYFWSKNNQLPPKRDLSTIKSETIDEKSAVYPNYKHYINTAVNFVIDYPDYLIRTEFDPNGLPGAGIPAAKRVYFCKIPIDISKLDFTKGPTMCDGEGLLIQYATNPGWGGGCEPENHDTITLMGKPAGYCRYERSFGQLYYGSPRGEENNPKYNPYQFLFGGTYGEKLTRSEMEKMISTFKVID